MSYILFVIPTILSTLIQGQGPPYAATVTITAMPYSFAITNGIGAGFVMFTFLKLASGRWRSVHRLLYVIAAAFLIYVGLDWIERRFDL